MNQCKRIGLIIPSTNLTVEADFQTMLPAGVTAHSQRLWIPPGTMSREHLDVMNAGLAEAARLLASAHVDAIAYACTSGSFYKGPEWDEEAVATVRAEADIPVFTTSQAVAAALKAFGASRISVATPYPEWTNAQLKAYFEVAGYDILGVVSDLRAAANGHRMINDQDPAEIVTFAEQNHDGTADAVLLSCTAWRAFEAAGRIEERIGRPVVTSNQATMWMALQELGVDAARVAGRGSLFGR